MTFDWLVLLVALAVVVVGILAARAIDRRRSARLAGLGSFGRTTEPPAAGPRPRAIRRLTAALPTVLIVAAFVLFAVALARPHATVSLPRIEGTLMLTFDVSGSMAADDVTPSRLEAAKAAAKTIVEQLPPGVVVGVVAFSDAGLAIQTPTSEQATVLETIGRLGPSQGTSVGQGILAALGAIAKAESDTPASYYSNRSAPPSAAPAPVPPGSHDGAAIVLLSDGENNERPDPLSAAHAAADAGIRIITVGVGTAAGTTLDLDGFRVQSALDEDTLRQVADISAGEYVAAADLQPSTVFDQLARHLVTRDEELELTALVAAAGLVLLVLGTALSLMRQGRLP